jgi:hypothetical protein
MVWLGILDMFWLSGNVLHVIHELGYLLADSGRDMCMMLA